MFLSKITIFHVVVGITKTKWDCMYFFYNILNVVLDTC